MKAPVRFAVVGCGHIGMRHVAMVNAHAESELVACADIAWTNEASRMDDDAHGEPAMEPAVAAATVSSTSMPVALSVPCHGTLTELLAHHAVDVVSICTPNGSHVALAMEAIRAGCHVVVEKPLGLVPADVQALAMEAERANRLVFGVMQNRFAPAAQWLKATHETGEFGTIHQVHVTCLWNRDERYYTPGSWRGTLLHDGGPLFTQFSHFLDILLWVFGPMEVLDAHLENQTHQELTEFEDAGLVRFRLASGGWGSLTFSTSVAGGNFESSMTVVGSKGAVRIGGQYMDRLDECKLSSGQRPSLPPPPPPNDYGGYTGSAANHHFVYDNVMDVLLRGAPVATPIAEGLQVVQVIDHIHALGRGK